LDKDKLDELKTANSTREMNTDAWPLTRCDTTTFAFAFPTRLKACVPL